MKKQNLILVHSFPTNSIFLEGLIEFLSDLFNVYFIDLPGFNTKLRPTPLKEISFESYSEYVDAYISTLDIEDYYLGGISFGFGVVQNCKPSDRCKGFFAIEPFINTKYLGLNSISKLFTRLLLKTISLFKLHNFLFHSRLFKRLLLMTNPEDRVEMLLNTVDGKAFFETGALILGYNEAPKFQNKKYILVINEKDQTVAPDKIINLFKSQEDIDFLLVNTTADHFPEDLSKEYFERNIEAGDVDKILKFVE